MTPKKTPCPILADTEQISTLSKDIIKAMRKLRRDLAACRECPAGEDCEVLKSFNSTVHTAISEVVDEWGLTNGG